MAITKGVKGAREKRKNLGGNKYLKLKDGDTYLIAFVGVLINGEDEEPLAVEVVWKENKQGRYSELYDETKHDEDDIKTNFVWQVAVIDVTNLEEDEDVDFSKPEMKILQAGPTLFDDFIKARDGRKGLGYWYEYSREGSGQYDTKYKLQRDEKLEAEDMERFKALKFFDLVKEVSDNDRDDGSEDDEEPSKRSRRKRRRRRSDDAPKTVNKKEASDLRLVDGGDSDTINLEQMGRLKAAIKALEDHKAGQRALAEEFKVDRLQDLRASDFNAALQLIENLEKPTPEEEVTPATAVGDGFVDIDEEDDPFMDP